MRIGLVCPYSWDVPGGVQYHVRGLAGWLRQRGHEVRVLAPAEDESDLPDYLTSCGRAVPVRYNGSVARLTFGPVTAGRVSRWLSEGDFDVVHLHEPMTPSASVIALWAATGPIVATFHTSTLRSRAMLAAHPLLRPSLERITGRIAVSEDARRTVRRHIGGDAVVIPNGVDVAQFAGATPRPEWAGSPGRPTIGFLGRIAEPRKGFAVLAEAFDALLAAIPGARLLVAGPGEPAEVAGLMTARVAAATEFLGAVDDATKADLLASIDLYAAPNTHGESFGIVLVEAMATGTPVVASDLPAFISVLGERPGGRVFPTADPAALARVIVDLIRSPGELRALGDRAASRAGAFDWDRVGRDVVAVYDTVTVAAEAVR